MWILAYSVDQNTNESPSALTSRKRLPLHSLLLLLLLLLLFTYVMSVFSVSSNFVREHTRGSTVLDL